MQWGTDTEPKARKTYERYKNTKVAEVGFIHHPTIRDSGASPDGLVGNDGLIEIKCPKTKNHLKALESDAIHKKYLMQMQWQMACTGRSWCDFVSYDPRAPKGRRLYVKRVKADTREIERLEKGVREFLKELSRKLEDDSLGVSSERPSHQDSPNRAKRAATSIAQSKGKAKLKKVVVTKKTEVASARSKTTDVAPSYQGSQVEDLSPFRRYNCASEGKLNAFVTFSENVSSIQIVNSGIDARMLIAVCPKGTSDNDIETELEREFHRTEGRYLSQYRAALVFRVKKVEANIFSFGENVSTTVMIAYLIFMFFGGLTFIFQTADGWSKIALWAAPFLLWLSGALEKVPDWITSALAQTRHVDTGLLSLRLAISPKNISEVKRIWMTGRSVPVERLEEFAATALFEPLTKEEQDWFLKVMSAAKRRRMEKAG
jgi:hypothetical protein